MPITKNTKKQIAKYKQGHRLLQFSFCTPFLLAIRHLQYRYDEHTRQVDGGERLEEIVLLPRRRRRGEVRRGRIPVAVTVVILRQEFTSRRPQNAYLRAAHRAGNIAIFACVRAIAQARE